MQLLLMVFLAATIPWLTEDRAGTRRQRAATAVWPPTGRLRRDRDVVALIAAVAVQSRHKRDRGLGHTPRALSRDAGFDYHLLKPVEPLRLIELLR